MSDSEKPIAQELGEAGVIGGIVGGLAGSNPRCYQRLSL